MQVKVFLADYLHENPLRNFFLPYNSLRIQDILRKAFLGTGFRLMLNGIDILEGHKGAIFFQIYTKFLKKNQRKGTQKILDFLEFWKSQDPLFKVYFDSSIQRKQLQTAKTNKKPQKSFDLRINRSKAIYQQKSLKKQQLIQKSLIDTSQMNKSKNKQISYDEQTLINNMISDFSLAIERLTSSVTRQTDINSLINELIKQLKSQNIPFSKLILKFEQLLPQMYLNTETHDLIKQLIKQYITSRNNQLEYQQGILRNILYEYSNPRSELQEIRKEQTQPNSNNDDSFTTITSVKTHERQYTYSSAYKKKLNKIFQAFSMGYKNKKGLTFDQITQQFNKMDLNSWMSFNKRYDTVTKLGIQEIYMIFKRFSDIGFLNFQRFQKAFRNLNMKLFGSNIEEGNRYFGISESYFQIQTKQVQLPNISKTSQKYLLNNTRYSPLKQTNSNSFISKSAVISRHQLKNNTSIFQRQKETNYTTHSSPKNEVQNIIQRLNLKIKQNKIKQQSIL